MAVGFNQVKGAAVKNSAENLKFKDGLNTVRLFGNIVPRYVYWIEGSNKKSIPIECLGFDRDKESFTNIEKDWVREHYPDLKCGWAYVSLCIDRSDGKIKVMNHKKKLFQSILLTAEDLGDPTDVESGWDLVFNKAKTGPLAYNVEYTINALKCSNNVKPLTEEELALIADHPPIEKLFVRPTPEQQKELLDKIHAAMANGGSDTPEDNKEDVENEFDVE